MGRKKVDNRIRVAIEQVARTGHRSLFVVVGDKGKDQVAILHHMLGKASPLKPHPSVMWCYKKELGFSSHRKKRMRQLQLRLQTSGADADQDNPFEIFVASTSIRYCYYSETHKILGSTFGMCVLQDFEALTPNLLARTIETVEGGGMVVILLRSVDSLRQLYTMTMDVHARYRTEAHTDVVGRFNERFILSLASCKNCLLINDQLKVLPHSSHVVSMPPSSTATNPDTVDPELKDLKESLRDTQPVGCLVALCKTLDQSKALLKCVEAVSEKALRSTVSVTAARGRGKSAALGLSVAAAVAFGYSNIFVTSPTPENLGTLFKFLFSGFDALGYQEHMDYDVVQSTNPDFNKAVVRVNVFRDHRQTVQYIRPNDARMLGQAELVVIDEAAAIPLPLVRDLLGPYLVFLSSTINGYEGTGRSLSLKLLDQLRKQAGGRILHEVTMSESIRYKPGDLVESWLSDLLCLDATSIHPLLTGCPPPQQCDLYYINRDTLFSYHKASEQFLQRLMSLYVASHYKNTPNDLQMMSDAPAHHLFCLLGPVDSDSKKLPEILVVIQVCLEGAISKQSVQNSMYRGKKAAGDMIPWSVAQQFQDEEFPALSGARIIRIATHPDFQGMGYGARAVEVLQKYYEFKVPSISDEEGTAQTRIEPVQTDAVGLLEERVGPRKELPPLLLKLSERQPESLNYLGVSYGVTEPLLKFWRRAGFVPVYVRQTANDLTGEYSCIMLKTLNNDSERDGNWLPEYFTDFRRRFISLLGSEFRNFTAKLSLGLLQNRTVNLEPGVLSREELEIHVNKYERKRLEAYSRNLADYHLVTDLLPRIAELYFLQKLGDVKLAAVQAAILLSLGLQRKSVDAISSELNLPVGQVLALFQRSLKQIAGFLTKVEVKAIESTLGPSSSSVIQKMVPLAIGLDQELNDAAKELKEKQKEEVKKMQVEDLAQYAIKGSEVDWDQALGSGGPKGLVSVKSGYKRPLVETDTLEKSSKGKKGHKGKKKKM